MEDVLDVLGFWGSELRKRRLGKGTSQETIEDVYLDLGRTLDSFFIRRRHDFSREKARTRFLGGWWGKPRVGKDLWRVGRAHDALLGLTEAMEWACGVTET